MTKPLTPLAQLEAQVRANPGNINFAHALIRALREKCEGLDQTFNLRWEADQRAIRLWQAAGKDRELVWPDHADLCVWLLERMTAAECVMEAIRRYDATISTSKTARPGEYRAALATYDKGKKEPSNG